MYYTIKNNDGREIGQVRVQDPTTNPRYFTVSMKMGDVQEIEHPDFETAAKAVREG